ncbi:MAG: acyl-CoA dehydratase activase [Planctomycetota bacterium]|jgi:predicted CoA-substrate-specific enzyme activase
MIYAGIDAGSRTLKAVITDGNNGDIIASAIADQGVEQGKLASGLYEKLLLDNHIDKGDVVKTVATGCGRNIVGFADATVTEISCHAAGVHRLVPEARTVIDIGGQDSKILRLDAKGKVCDFDMNDRCAAGTGRFFEMVADRLEVPLTKLGDMAAKSSEPAAISSMCALFAETEIVGLLAGGKESKDIIAGVQAAVASRICALAAGRIEPPVVFTGGVAMISGMDKALSAALGYDVNVSPTPQLTGALGAAVLAGDTTR